MKTLIHIGLTTLFLWGSPALAQEGHNTSARSRKAIAKVKPDLLKTLAQCGAQWGDQIYIRVFKGERELEVWVKTGETYTFFDLYSICYFSGDLGPKKKEGDRQAPEGFYEVKPDLMNPWSSYHLSFNIGYPNRRDRQLGYTGGLIMIHGSCVSIGCYAMTDQNIDKIYALVDASLRNASGSVPVHVFPFRMTDTRMETYQEHEHYDFWKQLQPGYTYFEKTRKVPKIKAVRGKYQLVSQLPIASGDAKK